MERAASLAGADNGVQQFGPTLTELSNPSRVSYTYNVTLEVGRHTAMAEFEGGHGYLPSSAEPIVVDVAGDTTPPVGTISINGGAKHTNNANVVLSVPASDGESAVASVALTGDPTLSSGWSGRPPGPRRSRERLPSEFWAPADARGWT